MQSFPRDSPFVLGPSFHPGFRPVKVGNTMKMGPQMGVVDVHMFNPPKPPKPPEKPLMPYMRYSRKVWDQVKAQNPDLKLWEIGKVIGAMWRDLTDGERASYNEAYEMDKVHYNENLKMYHNSPQYQLYLKEKQKADAAMEEEDRNKKKGRSEPQVSIQPADDRDDSGDSEAFSAKNVASARYTRNHRLITEIFDEQMVPDGRTVNTRARQSILHSQSQNLEVHQKKVDDELVAMVERHEKRKRKFTQSCRDLDVKIEEENTKEVKMSEEAFEALVSKYKEEMEKERAQKSKEMAISAATESEAEKPQDSETQVKDELRSATEMEVDDQNQGTPTDQVVKDGDTPGAADGETPAADVGSSDKEPVNDEGPTVKVVKVSAATEQEDGLAKEGTPMETEPIGDATGASQGSADGVGDEASSSGKESQEAPDASVAPGDEKVTPKDEPSANSQAAPENEQVGDAVKVAEPPSEVPPPSQSQFTGDSATTTEDSNLSVPSSEGDTKAPVKGPSVEKEPEAPAAVVVAVIAPSAAAVETPPPPPKKKKSKAQDKQGGKKKSSSKTDNREPSQPMPYGHPGHPMHQQGAPFPGQGGHFPPMRDQGGPFPPMMQQGGPYPQMMQQGGRFPQMMQQGGPHQIPGGPGPMQHGIPYGQQPPHGPMGPPQPQPGNYPQQMMQQHGGQFQPGMPPQHPEQGGMYHPSFQPGGRPMYPMDGQNFPERHPRPMHPQQVQGMDHPGRQGPPMQGYSFGGPASREAGGMERRPDQPPMPQGMYWPNAPSQMPHMGGDDGRMPGMPGNPNQMPPDMDGQSFSKGFPSASGDKDSDNKGPE